MNKLSAIFNDLYSWVKKDYRSYPLRFIVEVVAWILGISTAFTMACTVPNPPLLFIYPVWIIACMMYWWAALSRGSFGLLANYTILITIDIIGLIRMILNS